MTVYPGRHHDLRWQVPLIVVVGGAFGLAIAGWIGGLAVAAVAAVPLGWRLRRPRLEVDDQGMTVMDSFKKARILWTEVGGFGYSQVGARWGIEIRLLDGRTVPVSVLSDDSNFGNHDELVQDIVADLRSRLAATTGIVDRARTIELRDGEQFDRESVAPPEVLAIQRRRLDRWSKVNLSHIVIADVGFVVVGIVVLTSPGAGVVELVVGLALIAAGCLFLAMTVRSERRSRRFLRDMDARVAALTGQRRDDES